MSFETTEESHERIATMMAQFPPGVYPHLVEFAKERVREPGYTHGNEFGFGLELILDGLVTRGVRPAFVRMSRLPALARVPRDPLR